jgi:hypothetical protein
MHDEQTAERAGATGTPLQQRLDTNRESKKEFDFK